MSSENSSTLALFVTASLIQKFVSLIPDERRWNRLTGVPLRRRNTLLTKLEKSSLRPLNSSISRIRHGTPVHVCRYCYHVCRYCDESTLVRTASGIDMNDMMEGSS